MTTNLTRCVSGILLVGTVATVQAQSTWAYFLSDAGGGNSLLTWTVTGSLATSPGAILVSSESSIAVSINAPGIYADSYAGGGTSQPIPAPDGSYFQLDDTSVYIPILAYDAYNAPATGNDSFGLTSSTLFPHQGEPGHAFLYNPGTQSVLIPIDYSNFNPGTYQSEESGFDTALTVKLTISAVPEPSVVALSGVSVLLACVVRNKNFK